MWSIDSWKTKRDAQPAGYADDLELAEVVNKLCSLPPLVTSWEIERLKSHLADAELGRRFVLQGGDCAETLDGCQPDVITRMLKILLQMSLVLIQGAQRPVVRIGRFAGQYAKPRSSPEETREGITLPSYRGDLVNRPAFDAAARRPDPRLMLDGYAHAAMTLNFIRALGGGGFADLHHPEYWDLSFLERADLPPDLREEYERTSAKLAEALRFMEALGETTIDELTRVEIFTSHEGLNLHYESAQTREVPRREGRYCLTTHLPWIGERTRDPAGAHVEFFRGVKNPIGVKLGPRVTQDELARLADVLDPEREPGKLVLVTRLGADQVERALPPLVSALKRAGRRALFLVDPMHGNTFTAPSGHKTRDVERILLEVERTFDVLEACGARLGGVHLELTGEDVTECVGGGVRPSDLHTAYASACDPRLNYRQAMEMAFHVARRLARSR